MKRFLGISMALVFLGLVVFNSELSSNLQSSKNQIKKDLDDLVSVYNDALFKAFYSLPEIRPFAIIQVDKVVQMYGDEWLSPNDIFKVLTDNDKQLLLKQVVVLIDAYQEDYQKQDLLKKLKMWCINYEHFDFLKNKVMLSDEEMFDLLQKIEVSNITISQFLMNQQSGTGVLSGALRDEARFEVINTISEIEFEEQMKFYSEVYQNISSIAKY